jgi:Fumarylacetoacetate (FAA) hydrolase family
MRLVSFCKNGVKGVALKADRGWTGLLEQEVGYPGDIDDLIAKGMDGLGNAKASLTGTPSGVGLARNPPVYMRPGDICEVEVEGIGILSNPIVDEWARYNICRSRAQNLWAFFSNVGGYFMRQDKRLNGKGGVATPAKSQSSKRKTVKRQKVFKTSSWYERAAFSIKAAPSRA